MTQTTSPNDRIGQEISEVKAHIAEILIELKRLWRRIEGDFPQYDNDEYYNYDSIDF